jgi:hypothetical protein
LDASARETDNGVGPSGCQNIGMVAAESREAFLALPADWT